MPQVKNALVTGANRGLGLEIARQLGGRGHRVFVGSRQLERGVAAAAGLRAAGIDARAVQLDSTDAVSIAAALRTIGAQVERLDVLVNNAGTFVEAWGTPPSALTLTELRATFEVNFFGAFAVLRECMPLLLNSDAARVVNISSDMASLTHISNPASPVYAVVGPAYQASKVALNALTTLFARQFKGSAAKINSASPGWCRTDMGGEAAPLSVAEGAATAVWLATLPDDGPSGQFFSATRERGAMEW